MGSMLKATEDMESHFLGKGLASGSHFQCLVYFTVPCLEKSQLTHCPVEICEFLMSLAKQNVSEGTTILIRSWVFAPCELPVLSQGGKITWLCIFIDIFSFKKSRAFLPNFLLILALRRHFFFFWIILYERSLPPPHSYGYLLPTLRTLVEEAHLQKTLISFAIWPSFQAHFMLLCWPICTTPLGKGLVFVYKLFYRLFFFPLQRFSFMSGVGEYRQLFHE